MENVYFGRLKDFRRGLTRIKFKPFIDFPAGQEKCSHLCGELIRAALDYRYRNRGGAAVEMTAKDLSENPVFEFKQRDKIPVRNRVIDGKRLRELYVTSVFASYLDGLPAYNGFPITGRRMLIGYPEQDTGIDTAIFVTEDAPIISDGSYAFRAIAGKSSLSFYIQTKEYYNFNDFQQSIVHPKPFEIRDLGIDKLRTYQDMILIYVRSFCTINFNEVKADLARHGLAGRHIVLIGMEALTEQGELPKEYTLWDFKRDGIFKAPGPICPFFYNVEEIKKQGLPIKTAREARAK
jgi:hypothetical protein